MEVMKFGGSCLRSVNDLSSIAGIVKLSTSPPVLVVSAFYGVTDLLVQAVGEAVLSHDSIPHSLSRVRNHHLNMLQKWDNHQGIGTNHQAIQNVLDKMQSALYEMAYIEVAPPHLRNEVLSCGERLSAIIVASYLQNVGVPALAVEADNVGLVTDECLDGATANLPQATTNLQQHLEPLLRDGKTVVFTGFFGATPSGQVSTFGRNSSDYSAAVVAHALGASKLVIWKDVLGFLTADPRVVGSNASTIPHLSYNEAAELAYFGAKILHPRVVEPLIAKNIPIEIRSNTNPTGERTMVGPEAKITQNVLKSIAVNPHIIVVRLHGSGVGIKPGLIGEVGDQLAHEGINITSVLTSQTCINLLVEDRDREKVERVLNLSVGGVVDHVEVRSDLGLVAAVGAGLVKTKGIMALVFSSLARAKINVEMICMGASDSAYYFLVAREDIDEAVQAVHNQFFGRSPHYLCSRNHARQHYCHEEQAQ